MAFPRITGRLSGMISDTAALFKSTPKLVNPVERGIDGFGSALLRPVAAIPGAIQNNPVKAGLLAAGAVGVYAATHHSRKQDERAGVVQAMRDLREAPLEAANLNLAHANENVPSTVVDGGPSTDVSKAFAPQVAAGATR